MLVAALVIGYAVVLEMSLFDYRIATILFVLAAGSSFCGSSKLQLVLVALLSVLLGLGLHYVFTQVLVIDLP